VRFNNFRFVFALLLCAAPSPASLQETSPQAQSETPKDQFFSGTVTQIDDTKITVLRTVLGKPSATKAFAVTADTKFEGGKPARNSRVTVRYVAGDDGDRALHVIVRTTAKK
jgi:hypothetical protein